MNALEKAQIYSKYLSQEGYVPTVDNDGDVIFKVEGKVYYISIDTKDELFFGSFSQISGVWIPMTS